MTAIKPPAPTKQHFIDPYDTDIVLCGRKSRGATTSAAQKGRCQRCVKNADARGIDMAIVKCPWCYFRVQATGGVMAPHQDFYPLRACEGGLRRAECSVDGCSGIPHTGRETDLCYRHKWMEKADGKA